MKQFLQLIAMLLFVQQIQAKTVFFKDDSVIDPPTVTISYPIMCETDSFPYPVTMEGTGNYTGGTFSCSPLGLFMSAQTGEIVPNLSAPGIYEVTYTIPASGPDPMVQTTTQVIIAQALFPTFSIPTLYCTGEQVPMLPMVSDNGITGTWSPGVVSNQEGTTVYTFIPMGTVCVQPYVLTITIGICPGIRLNAYLDSNSNGVKDTGEFDFPMAKFSYEKNNDGIITDAIASSGTYILNDTDTTNSYGINFSIVSPYDTMYQATTTSITNVYTAIPHPVHEFAVTAVQAFEDLKVSLVPVSSPRPGFFYDNVLVYANYGSSAVANGSVSFVKDSHVTIGAVSQSGVSITATGFTYDFTNLQPCESRQILVTLQAPTMPSISIGQQLANSASIAYGDGTVNDTATLSQTVIGSYDPNDITEKHGPEIVWQDFTASDELEYTIRFENTGTANAESIRIVDVLDAQLNPETISFVASSHPCSLEKTGNQLTFVIDDAQLPPSVAETNIGKGFVTFRIKPDAGYALGDIIPSTASIYFDFNPAIVTDQWNTEFVAPLAVKNFQANTFVVYPNPASDVFKVRVNGTADQIAVTIHDMLGKTVLTQTVSDDTVNVEKLKPGMYLLSITSGESKSVQKLIVR